jgi:hypothetical protein
MARYFEHLGDPDPGATSFEGHTGAHLEFVVEMHHQFARDHVVAAPGLSGAADREWLKLQQVTRRR